MKNHYRLFRRAGGVYYAEDVVTRRQESLKTRDKASAQRLLNAKNAAAQQPLLNLATARIHLAASDPRLLTRTWQQVMDEFSTHGRASTQDRSFRAFKSTIFDAIRNRSILETTAEEFLRLMKRSGSSAAHYLRRLHNLAIDLGWLPWPILAKKAWPKLEHGTKRAITVDEFKAIVKAEGNQERRHYYQILWEIGSAQLDAAKLTAENIHWNTGTLCYNRQKLHHESQPCVLKIGPKLETILRELPQSGPLFPKISLHSSKERAAEFRRRCRILGIRGVTLHSFRYAWAERACRSGYPERFAQAALGHASKAVHRAYARGAKVLCPPLDSYEAHVEQTIIPFPNDAPSLNNEPDPHHQSHLRPEQGRSF